MKVRLIHAFLGVGAVLLAGCAQDRTITRGLKGAPQLRTTLVQAIPLGSDLASGQVWSDNHIGPTSDLQMATLVGPRRWHAA